MTSKPAPVTPPTLETIIVNLAYAAESRRHAQKELDKAKRKYDRKLNELSKQAINATIIPTGDGDEKRLAKNEEERKIVLRTICLEDETFCRLEAVYQAKLRDAQFYTDSQVNFRQIAEMAHTLDVNLKPF